jgi:serine/threonine protein kinase/tetratricopeptide (TPR) repeat protein
MKTFSPGFCDSIAGVIEEPRPCPHCHSSSHIAGGLCVGCLLEAGLDPIDDRESETLTDILAEVRLPDQNWRLGNYEILEEIGRGGMGVIYRARQRHSRRIVAVKRVLSYHADSRETLARFRREAQAAASLDHPNILPIYEVSESEDGLPFFSMKFAPGGTLQQVAPALRKETRQCVALVAKVARAVQYAHSRGILHRDLKPGNVLLDARSEPLVSDFGLAKWLDTTSDLTRTLTIFGTPGYIAPEQASAAAAELKPTADIYSLGAILFDLLAGRPPFLGAHALSVIRQAAEFPAPKLRTLSNIADRDLETICSRCLEREPSARYRSAHDLAEDLERWLEGRPIIARRISPPTRVWRWSRRNPKLAGSVVASIVFASAALLWQSQNHRLSATVREEQLAARSIAVLPFLDLDTGRPDTTLPAALSYSLQANLNRLAVTRIAAVSSPDPWLAGTGNLYDIKQANRVLKARAILTGTKRIVAGKLKLSIRLMNAATGEVILSRLLDAPFAGAGAREAEQAIEGSIHSILSMSDWSGLSPAVHDPGMENSTAREFILSGRELMLRQTVETFDKSIACLERAIELEPRSAMAHAFLATAACSRTYFVSDDRFLKRAEAEAKEAIRLDPNSADAHRALAGVSHRNGRFEEALEEQFRAVELAGPEERIAGFIGLTLDTLEQPQRALGWYELARHWESRPGTNDACIGKCWAKMGDDLRAEEAYRRAADLRPEISQGWVGLCHLRLLQGDMEGARSICRENLGRFKGDNDSDQIAAQVAFFSRNYSEARERYQELEKRDSRGGTNYHGEISYESVLGCVSQALGDVAGGRTILERARVAELEALKKAPKSPAILYRLAAIDACLGEIGDALKEIDLAVRNGWLDYRTLRIDPRFDTLAHNPHFQEMIANLARKVTLLTRQTDPPTKVVLNGEHSPP